jgi:hypothetical protein
MAEIRVADLFGPVCVAEEDGEKLFALARSALECGEVVRLDFSGVSTVTGPFLIIAVGRLYASFTPEDLQRRLLWNGLDDTDEAVFRIVQQHAVRFYSATDQVKEALATAAFRALGDDPP